MIKQFLDLLFHCVPHIVPVDCSVSEEEEVLGEEKEGEEEEEGGRNRRGRRGGARCVNNETS